MKAYVNESCIGCGMCNSICDEVFEMNADGLAEATGVVTAENEASVREAMDSCPVGAIEEQ